MQSSPTTQANIATLHPEIPPNLDIHLRETDVTWRCDSRSSDGRRVLMKANLLNPFHLFKTEILLFPTVWVDCDADGTPLELPQFPLWLVPR